MGVRSQLRIVPIDNVREHELAGWKPEEQILHPVHEHELAPEFLADTTVFEEQHTRLHPEVGVYAVHMLDVLAVRSWKDLVHFAIGSLM